MISPPATRMPRSLMAYSVGASWMLSRTRTAGEPGCRIPDGDLLTAHRDPIEWSIAALGLVDERNEREADFEFDWVDLEQVAHLRGSRRPRGGVRGHVLDDALLFRRGGDASEHREPGAEKQEGNLREARQSWKKRSAENHRPAIRQRARLGAELFGEHHAHARSARGVGDHDAGRRADDQRRDLRDETVADR